MLPSIWNRLRLIFRRWHRQRNWKAYWASGVDARWELNRVSATVKDCLREGVFRPGMRLLDIGCGAGHNAAWLADQGLDVVGADFSPTAIHVAQRQYRPRSGLFFCRADFVGPLSGFSQFDALLDRGCLHGLDRNMWPQYFRNITLLLKAGGTFVLLAAEHHIPVAELQWWIRNELPDDFFIQSCRSVEMLETCQTDSLSGVCMVICRQPLESSRS